MAGIHLSALTKVFPGGVTALDHVDLEIHDGEFFALLGPSGCGKTTLLRVIAGLESPSGGSVGIGGRDVTRLAPGARDLAMVFQDYALYPHMDVADNIAYPLKIKKLDRRARRRQATETAGQLGLAEMMDRRPAQLSGGQQQRVALARAVACHPQAFLFDEPLSNLDARLRMEARTFLKRLHSDLMTTTVYVTHDQSEALALSDRMAVMDHGIIRQLGTPSEIFHKPANLFVARFIGSTPMNLLKARVSGEGLALAGCSVPVPPSVAGRLRDGHEVVLGTRPEYTRLSPSPVGDDLPGRVEISEDLGTSYLVTLQIRGPDGELPVQVVVPEGATPTVGADMWIAPDWQRALVYQEETGELITSTPARATEAVTSKPGPLA